MTTQEYNRIRYRTRYKRNFLVSIKSYEKILSSLGFTVVRPDDAALDTAVDAYLAARPRRERIVENGVIE